MWVSTESCCGMCLYYVYPWPTIPLCAEWYTDSMGPVDVVWNAQYCLRYCFDALNRLLTCQQRSFLQMFLKKLQMIYNRHFVLAAVVVLHRSQLANVVISANYASIYRYRDIQYFHIVVTFTVSNYHGNSQISKCVSQYLIEVAKWGLLHII